MSEPIKIELCPVCQSFPVHHTDVAKYDRSDWVYWVGCANSRCLRGPIRQTQAEAITEWNRLSQANQLLVRLESDVTREGLAEYAHTAWAGWMRYQFSKAPLNEDGSWTMPAWAVERWQRQMSTPYAGLPESEKASDRKEADEILAIALREVTK